MKRMIWVGLGLVLVGVGLGLVKSGECGSVFHPRDDGDDAFNALLGGSPPPDCSTALDLTGLVWLLIVVGAVALVVGLVAAWASTPVPPPPPEGES